MNKKRRNSGSVADSLMKVPKVDVTVSYKSVRLWGNGVGAGVGEGSEVTAAQVGDTIGGEGSERRKAGR